MLYEVITVALLRTHFELQHLQTVFDLLNLLVMNLQTRRQVCLKVRAAFIQIGARITHIATPFIEVVHNGADFRQVLAVHIDHLEKERPFGNELLFGNVVFAH